MVISDGEDEGGDEGGGGVLVQAQPFTGQLADEEQADQGVAELEPRVAFHKSSSSFQLRPCLHAVGKGVQAINYPDEKRKSWVATFLVRRRFATGAQGLC